APAAISKPRPNLPLIPLTWDQMATAKAHELSAQARNRRDSTQLYSPLAYSLNTRNEGSNSGLSTCKPASSRRTAPAAAIATRAAGAEIFAVSVSEIGLSIEASRT